MSQKKQPERHYITMPIDAMPLKKGDRINQRFWLDDGGRRFKGRHTYSLSTHKASLDGKPDIYDGDLAWFIIEGKRSTGVLGNIGNQARLTERGVYQHGVDTVILKMPARTPSLDVLFKGKDRCDYTDIRLLLGHLLSWDNPTAQIVEQEVCYPDGSIGRFTGQHVGILTHHCHSPTHGKTDAGERFHFDFALAYPQSDTDHDNPDNKSWRTQLLLLGDCPSWYDDEKKLDIAPSDINKNDTTNRYTFATDDFPLCYEGSARGGFRLELKFCTDIPPTFGGVFVHDVDNGVDSIFAFEGTTASGWQIESGGECVTIVLDVDTCERLRQFTMYYGDEDDAIGIDLDASLWTDWCSGRRLESAFIPEIPKL